MLFVSILSNKYLVYILKHEESFEITNVLINLIQIVHYYPGLKMTLVCPIAYLVVFCIVVFFSLEDGVGKQVSHC